jgi:hypothetical protein
VREHDGAERVDPVAEPGHEVEVRARVDQRRRIARDQKDVAGERVHVGGEVLHAARRAGARVSLPPLRDAPTDRLL